MDVDDAGRSERGAPTEPALLALALACLAVFLVASVAWPFPRAGSESGEVDARDAVATTALAGVVPADAC